MAPTPPSGEPAQLVIGSNWEWDKSYAPAPPSEGYTLKYDLHGKSSVTTISASTSSSGDYYEIREAKADTAGLEPGTYILVGYIEKGTDRFEIYRAEVYLQEDLTASTVVDSPTHDEKVLAQINTAIETLTLNPWASSSVDGQRVEYADLEMLMKRQGVYRARVAHARRQGQFPKRKIHFAAPS